MLSTNQNQNQLQFQNANLQQFNIPNTNTVTYPVRVESVARIFFWQYVEYWVQALLVLSSLIPMFNLFGNYFIIMLMRMIEDNILQAVLDTRAPYTSIIWANI